MTDSLDLTDEERSRKLKMNSAGIVKSVHELILSAEIEHTNLIESINIDDTLVKKIYPRKSKQDKKLRKRKERETLISPSLFLSFFFFSLSRKM